jgi:hypothetical protein
MSTTWADFAAAAPDLADRGRGLLERTGHGSALLATVRDDLPPRINPISLAVVDGHLVAYLIVGSAKLADLEADGRYAFHAHQDPAVPHEFLVRRPGPWVTDAQLVAKARSGWFFEADDGYRLYEFAIEHAVWGERTDPNDWPPVYTSWRPTT